MPTMSLSDGRRLGYAEHGDPHGEAVLWFPGTPGSRFTTLDTVSARRAGARLVAIERPGFGLSDPKPDRTLLGFAEDVRELANALAIERFAIAGVSGGAPYVLACALALSHRVRAAAIVAGGGPLEAPGVID